MGESAIKEFFRYFSYSEIVNLIPIDDRPKNYSHTAILAKSGKCRDVKPLYNSLRSGNKIQYAGKDLAFRKANPKGFIQTKKIANSVILIDDIVTTGTTLKEAKEVLEKNGVNVLFALAIASS